MDRGQTFSRQRRETIATRVCLRRLVLGVVSWAVLWCCPASGQPNPSFVVSEARKTAAEPPAKPSGGPPGKPAVSPGSSPEGPPRVLAKPTGEAPPQGGPASPAPGSAHQVEEASFPVYYLKNKNGDLVPVLGFTLEYFEDLLKRKYRQDPADRVPPYSLQALSIAGAAKGDFAELSVQARFLVRDESWVRIPLRLDQAVLQGGAKYQGPGQQFLHFEPGGEGYVAWVRGGVGQQHELSFKVLVPLVRAGDETRLRLFAPPATSSELKLTVPQSGIVAEASEGATLLPAQRGPGDATSLTVLGVGRDFELSWRKTASQPAEAMAALEATGNILAKVDERGLDLETRLSVLSKNGTFEAFRVRLPKGADPPSSSSSPYAIRSLDPPGASGGPDRRLIEVRLPHKTSGPVEVLLKSRLSFDKAAPAGSCELTGYEVLDAAGGSGHRVSGQIAVTAEGAWHVLVGQLRGVRQLDEPPESSGREERAARFEYFSPSFSLPLRVVPRKGRVAVEPEYLVLVEAGQMTLQARLKYTVRTAQVSALEVELSSWKVDEIGPDNLVASFGEPDASGVLSIPLAQPVKVPVELTLRAHRAIPAGAKSIAFELPRPRADDQAPATLVVLPADDVELIPTAKTTTGLVRQQVAPPMKLPERQQAPLFYRGDSAKAVFAADFVLHEQKITVAVDSQIALDEQKVQVRQSLAYGISYKPLDRVTLEVPQELAGLESLKVLLEDKPLPLVDLAEPQTSSAPAGSVRKQVALPPPVQIGSCKLAIVYSLEAPRLVPKTGVAATIPLVMPVEGELSGNVARVSAKEGIQVRPREGLWSPLDVGASQGPRRRGLPLQASRRAGDLPLTIELEDPSALGTTAVNRAWVQTWLTGTRRQDRAVFCLTGNQRSVELIVPAGVNLGEVELLLDDKRIAAQATPEGHLVVPLSADAGYVQRRLEAVYHFPTPRPEPGLLALELPRLGRDAWVHRMYWQLVLPRKEHVILTPTSPAGDSFAGEYSWGWNGLFWGRKPLLEQAQLESWCGARHLADVSGESNRYLFSALGTVGRCELYTAVRPRIVLLASGIALVVGLTLIYVPKTRHPAALLVAAVALGSAAVLEPEPVLLVAQAASLGVALSIVAGMLHRGVVRRRQRTRPRELSSSVVRRSSPQTHPRSPAADHETPTETVPATAPNPNPPA